MVYAGSAARGPRRQVDRFLEAVVVELELRARHLDQRFGAVGTERRPPLASLYLGGGTPSLLDGGAVAGLVRLVGRRFGLAPDAEITLEANPGPDDRGDMAAFAAAGVTRLSLGAQSLDAAALRRLGRRHRPTDVADAVRLAREAEIGSVSVDLLYDVPGMSLAAWRVTLDAALALGPDHLSLYALTLDDPLAEGLTGPRGDHLPTTAGARRWRTTARREQDEDRAAEQYGHAVRRLAAGGWHAYEISNWARPGHEARHNLAYWERRPVEAVGPGAHAFDGRVRRWNAAPLAGYVAALLPSDGAPPRLPPGGSETVDDRTAAAERAILGLRTDRGLPAAAASAPPLAGAHAWALAANLIEHTPDDRIVLTTRGRLLSSELFARLV